MRESISRLASPRGAILFAVAGVLVTTLSTRASAQTINLNLYSTGENSVWSAPVQMGYTAGSTDTQWSIVSTPGGGGTAALVTIPNPAWVPNSSTSQWISDLANSSSPTIGSASGPYDYQTSFIIPTNVILSTVQVQFQYAADDTLTSVLVDNSSAGISGGGFVSLSGIQTLNSGNAAFQYGTNTIDFVTSNGGGAQGLNVKFTSATGSTPTPEPSSLFLLMGVALPVGGVAASGFRKRLARKS